MHSFGLCVLLLHIDNKVFPTIFEVTNTPGPIILGRVQAKAMGYVQFPQIWWPHTLNTFQHTHRNLCMHKTHAAKTTETAFQPQVSIHKTTPIKKTKQNKHFRLQNQYYHKSNGTLTPSQSMVRCTNYQSTKNIS